MGVGEESPCLAFLMWPYGVQPVFHDYFVWPELLYCCESVSPSASHILRPPTSPGLKQPDRPSAAAALLCVLFCGFSACAFGWQQPGVDALVDVSAAESISSSFNEEVGCCAQLCATDAAFFAPFLLHMRCPFWRVTSHAQISLTGPSGVLHFRVTQPLPPADFKCPTTRLHRGHFTLKQQRTK